MQQLLPFLAASLVIYRVTRVFVADTIFLPVKDKTVELLEGFPRVLGFVDGLWSCYWCLGFWLSLPAAMYLVDGWHDVVVWWFALSAAVGFLSEIFD